MKLGVCTNMLTSPDDRFGVDNIAAIAEAGFEYIELPMVPIVTADERSFQNLLKTLADSPVRSEGICSLLPPGIRVVGGEYDKKKLVEYIKTAASRAAALKVKIVGFGAPLSRAMMDPPYSLKDTLSQLAEVMDIIIDCMYEYGIAVLMEPVNRTECNVINTLKQSVEFCKLVNRKGFGSILDYHHFTVNGELHSTILKNKEMIAHIHIARPFGRRFPTDEQEENYAKFIRTLYTAGYNGNISVEAVSKDVGIDAKAAYRLLKELICRYYV